LFTPTFLIPFGAGPEIIENHLTSWRHRLERITGTRGTREANWSRVFSPAFIAKLREDIPHEMFVDEGEAMLGQGQLWFDGRGLTIVNAE
jgi:hypothetical protein